MGLLRPFWDLRRSVIRAPRPFAFLRGIVGSTAVFYPASSPKLFEMGSPSFAVRRGGGAASSAPSLRFVRLGFLLLFPNVQQGCPRRTGRSARIELWQKKKELGWQAKLFTYGSFRCCSDPRTTLPST